MGGHRTSRDVGPDEMIWKPVERRVVPSVGEDEVSVLGCLCVPVVPQTKYRQSNTSEYSYTLMPR